MSTRSGTPAGAQVGVATTAVLVGVLVRVFVGGTAVLVGVLVEVFVGGTAVLVGVFVGVLVGGTAVLVGVLVLVGLAVTQLPKVFTSTVLVSSVPLNPPTTINRFPTAVPAVNDRDMFMFGPVDHVFATVS
jgi:hypothetical protein